MRSSFFGAGVDFGDFFGNEPGAFFFGLSLNFRRSARNFCKVRRVFGGTNLMAGGISATRVRLLSTGWEIQASPAEGFDFQVTGSHSLPSQIAVSGSARNR